MGSKQIQDFDIVSLSSADSLVIQNSTGSYKRFIGSDLTTPLSSLAARVLSLESVSMGTLYETASDYVILDTDNYGYIWVDARTGDKTITLPTLADNQGREILIGASHHGGAVIVDGEGAETIDGNTTFTICNQYGFIRVKAIAGGWVSISHQSVFNTGWVSCSDWTTRHLGAITITYSGSSGTFVAGEEIYESSLAASTTTGKGGIVVSVSTSALVVRDVTGGGSFVNTYFIHGMTSSAGAVVAADTKNVDTNLYHGMRRNACDLSLVMWYSPTGVENGAVNMVIGQGNYTNDGAFLYQISTNEVKVQTGSQGYKIISDAGSEDGITTEDSYYRIVIKYVK